MTSMLIVLLINLSRTGDSMFEWFFPYKRHLFSWVFQDPRYDLYDLVRFSNLIDRQ